MNWSEAHLQIVVRVRSANRNTPHGEAKRQMASLRKCISLNAWAGIKNGKFVCRFGGPSFWRHFRRWPIYGGKGWMGRVCSQGLVGKKAIYLYFSSCESDRHWMCLCLYIRVHTFLFFMLACEWNKRFLHSHNHRCVLDIGIIDLNKHWNPKV